MYSYLSRFFRIHMNTLEIPYMSVQVSLFTCSPCMWSYSCCKPTKIINLLSILTTHKPYPAVASFLFWYLCCLSEYVEGAN